MRFLRRWKWCNNHRGHLWLRKCGFYHLGWVLHWNTLRLNSIGLIRGADRFWNLFHGLLICW